jgi:hypothetical protein
MILTKIIYAIYGGIKSTAKVRYLSCIDDLKSTPYLYGSEHIKGLVKLSIQNKDKESLKIIKTYLEKYEVGDIASYKSIIKLINTKLKYLTKEAIESIDITDIF